MGVAYQDHNGMAPHHDPRSIPYNTSQTQPGKPVQVPEPVLVSVVAYQDHKGMAPHHDPQNIPYNTSQIQPAVQAHKPVQQEALKPVQYLLLGVASPQGASPPSQQFFVVGSPP